MKNVKFAIVVSDFNCEITERLLQGAQSHLLMAGVAMEDIYVAHVPGAIELPLAAQWLAQTKKYHAIIMLGAVVRGETSHYDYVCQQVSAGCMRVMLTFNLPVTFGVLTTENEDQAYDRLGGAHGHKGEEAAATALAMVKARAMIF